MIGFGSFGRVPVGPVAVGLVGGIALGGLGLDPKVPLVLGLGVLCACRLPSHWVRAGGAVLLGVGCGLWRVGEAEALPTDDVGWLVRAGPQLVRVEGVVAQGMRRRAAIRRNAFLPYEPQETTRFVLLVRRCNGVPRGGRVAVTLVGDCADLPLGTPIALTGWLDRPQAATNPGALDWAEILQRRGIACVLRVPSQQLLRWSSLPAQRGDALLLLRGRVMHGLSAYALPESARRLLSTLVLGQRSAADAALNDAFARTGSLHYLAVSGFHVGVLLWLSWSVLRWLLGSGWLPTVGCALVLVAYALVAEPNPPILRATTLGVLWCGSQLLGRGRCSMNWLAMAAVVVLWVSPGQLWRAGFQLSFLQVLMLLQMRGFLMATPTWEATTWAGVVLRWSQQVGRQWLLVAVLSWLMAAPLVAWHFGRLAPWGALQSALLVPFVVLTFSAGLIALLAAPVVWSVPVLQPVVQVTSGWLLDMVALLGAVPTPLVEVRAPSGLQLVLFYAALLSCVLPLRLRMRCGLVALSLGLCLVPSFAPRDQPRLCVLDVGAGSAAIFDNGRKTIVLDAGTRSNFSCGETIADAIEALDMPHPTQAWISHANLDHYSGLPDLRTRWPEMVAWGNPSVAAQFSVRAVTSDTGIADLEVLWPPADLPVWVRENDRSLVLRVLCGQQRVLITGDIEDYAMDALLQRDARGDVSLVSDVLIAPHHGSVLPRNTLAFYRRVAPKLVVASSDRARPGLRQLMDAAGLEASRLLVTADVGAVTISDQGVRVGSAQRATAAP